MDRCNHQLFFFHIPENIAKAFQRKIAPLEVDLTPRHIYINTLDEFKELLDLIAATNYWLMLTPTTILAGNNYVRRNKICPLCKEKINHDTIKRYLLS